MKKTLEITEEEMNAFYGYLNLLMEDLSEEEVEKLINDLENLEKTLDEENNNLGS